MIYCVKCVIPDTRPNIVIDQDGLCNACKFHNRKIEINWQQRQSNFAKVVENAKANSKNYDCVIPVSGGKDSTWQVIKCLEYGLNPLTVTWAPPARTNIGKQNLENLINLGVDHIDYRISPKVEKKFMYQALVRFGTPAIPMHMALFNIPLKIAVKFSIPLVVWGENSAFEYGGTEEESKGFQLDQKWLAKFGVTHNTIAEDWVSSRLSQNELCAYFGPTQKELDQQQTLAVFLGYYFCWDPQKIMEIAKQYGFQELSTKAKTGHYKYADIDDDFISIHHYLKWYKFGFTRLYDNLSLEIRNGRISRQEAIAIIRERGDDTPHEDIDKFCEYIEIKREHFFEVIEKFRNTEIWKQKNGKWIIENFLIDGWQFL